MRNLEGMNILVVEDDAMIAWDLASVLQERGAAVMLASSSAEALELIARCAPHAAFIDVRLNNENSELVCRHLSLSMIPFAFYTGHGCNPEAWPLAPMIRKPATYDQIVSCAQRMCIREAD